jgi:hypothetical protein
MNRCLITFLFSLMLSPLWGQMPAFRMGLPAESAKSIQAGLVLPYRVALPANPGQKLAQVTHSAQPSAERTSAKGDVLDTTWVLNYFLLEYDWLAQYWQTTGEAFVFPLNSRSTDPQVFKQIGVYYDQLAARNIETGDTAFYRVDGQIRRWPSVVQIRQLVLQLQHTRNNSGPDTLVVNLVLADTLDGSQGSATPVVFPSSDPAKQIYRHEIIRDDVIANWTANQPLELYLSDLGCIFPNQPFFMTLEFRGAGDNKMGVVSGVREAPTGTYYNQWLKTVMQSSGHNPQTEFWNPPNRRNTVGDNIVYADFLHPYFEVYVRVGPEVEREAVEGCMPAGRNSVSAISPAFVAYPNPVRSGETLSISHALMQSGETQIRVFDAHGRQVSAATASVSENETTVSLPTDGLASGLYCWEIQQGSLRASGRFWVH